MKKALITGITGQDGSYLSELLLDKGYEVHGIKRRGSSFNTERIDHIYHKYSKSGRFFLHYGDLTDSINVLKIISDIEPDEIYNLGAQSHVHVSFQCPEYTANVGALGPLRILEAVKICGLEKKTKIYQASTSELYGLAQETPQTENTPFYPRSPYGCAKLYAYWITKNYREAYGIFVCNGILFNHESPRRGETFVTRKITRGIVQIILNMEECLYLGNLNAKRDWGHAKDYVEAMYLALQQDAPDDYVVATGISTTVREFIRKSFEWFAIEIEFQGEGMDEVGIVKTCHNPQFQLETGREVIKVDPIYFRPTEVDSLLGDASKAREKLGWSPKYTLDEMIQEMMESDFNLLQKKPSNTFRYG